jgi:hypothetical protein
MARLYPNCPRFEVHSTTSVYSHPFEFHGFFSSIEDAREKGREILQETLVALGGKFKYDNVQILDNENPINEMINSCQEGRVANETMTR